MTPERYAQMERCVEHGSISIAMLRELLADWRRLMNQSRIDLEAARTLHPEAMSVGDATVIAGAALRRLSEENERLKIRDSRGG